MKVLFYDLTDKSIHDIYIFICKVCANNYYHKKQILFLTNEIEFWDNKLFTFDNYSFLPHKINKTSPIIISKEIRKSQIILNLTGKLIDDNQAEKLIEFILPDFDSINVARNKYKIYKSKKYKLKVLKY